MHGVCVGVWCALQACARGMCERADDDLRDEKIIKEKSKKTI